MILLIFYSQLLVSISNKIDIQSISDDESALKKTKNKQSSLNF